MDNIAVLVTSFNRKELTLKCLHTLFFQDGINTNFECSVFLLDDGSSDGTGIAIKNQFPKVNIIHGSGDLYWNRGMHMAWKNAIASKQKFDYFFWLNDDVQLYNYALKHLINCSKQTSSKAIICGVFESKKDSQIISYGGGNINGKKYYPNKLKTKQPQECTIINGNGVLVPKFVYSKVGLIDPIFSHSLGDHDYALRAGKLGIKSYTSKEFIGYCKKNKLPPIWCRPEVNFFKRLKSLYSPLGNSHPYYYSIYINRHFGFVRAIRNFISIHIRVLFPSLWIK